MSKSDSSDKSFFKDFRKFFFRGLATLLPTVVTIILLVKCYQFIQENISTHITEGAIRAYVLIDSDYPQLSDQEKELFKNEFNLSRLDNNSQEQTKKMRLWKLRRDWKNGPKSLIGFLLAIILVYMVGRLLASYIGHKTWHHFEKMVGQVPGFKQVYPYIKKITEYFLDEKKLEFNRVVLVEYPRKGLWAIGLVTGTGLTKMGGPDKKNTLAIFIPSSPTPFTGYVIHSEQSEVIDLPITIEEAIRFTISGGVIAPGDQAFEAELRELEGADKPDNQDNRETLQGDG